MSNPNPLPSGHSELDQPHQKGSAAASWAFGGVLVLFLGMAFWFGPENIPAWKLKVLGFLVSLAGGFCAYFLTGSFAFAHDHGFWRFRPFRLRAGGGFAIFVLLYFTWKIPVTELREKAVEAAAVVVNRENGSSPFKGVLIKFIGNTQTSVNGGTGGGASNGSAPGDGTGSGGEQTSTGTEAPTAGGDQQTNPGTSTGTKQPEEVIKPKPKPPRTTPIDKPKEVVENPKPEETKASAPEPAPSVARQTDPAIILPAGMSTGESTGTKELRAKDGYVDFRIRTADARYLTVLWKQDGSAFLVAANFRAGAHTEQKATDVTGGKPLSYDGGSVELIVYASESPMEGLNGLKQGDTIKQELLSTWESVSHVTAAVRAR